MEPGNAISGYGVEGEQQAEVSPDYVKIAATATTTAASSLLTSESASPPCLSSAGGSNMGDYVFLPGREIPLGDYDLSWSLHQAAPHASVPILDSPVASGDADDDGGRRDEWLEPKVHMFDKVLTPSDVGKLNRLVIPQKYAEKYFPLDAAEKERSVLLSFEDPTGKLWRFRYSYWNSSQSYVLTKEWSRFVFEKRLKPGDAVCFYRGAGEAVRDRLFMAWKSRTSATPLSIGRPPLAPIRSHSSLLGGSTAGVAPLAAAEPPLPPAAAEAYRASPSSRTRSSIKRLVEQLNKVRTIIVSSHAWLPTVKSMAFNAQQLLEDLLYHMLLVVIRSSTNHRKASSEEAAASSCSAKSCATLQLSYAMDDNIDAINSELELVIQKSRQSSCAALDYNTEMSAAIGLISRCILLARGTLRMMGVVGAESHNSKEIPAFAFDDLTYSSDINIARMNAQRMPAFVSDPIYLLPKAIRSLLYLDLSSCSDLTELPVSLGALNNIFALNISGCYSLSVLPESLGSLKSLQILVLCSCRKLKRLPVSIGSLSKLRMLDLSGCYSLEILPDSLVNLGHLQNLNLSDCRRLMRIPQLNSLEKLECLNFSGCHGLDLRFEFLSKPANLKCLTLPQRTDIQGFPDSFRDLVHHLDMLKWWKNNGVHRQCTPKVASLHSYRGNESIINRLLSESSDEDDVTSICVVGESGMGKTELVVRIYNHQMIMDTFNLRIWICMSDKKRLLEKIIEFTTGTSCAAASLSILEETVRDELTGKRFLLVLDDADIKDECFWSEVHKILNIGAEGSALIVTTKSVGVDRLVGATQTFYLHSLSDKECFTIFQEHTFGGFDTNSHPLASIGLKVINKCGGNPLCIKALSGLIRHSEHSLYEIGMLVGGISTALRLCYDLLPTHLKQCLKFCSLFPKDYVFVKHHIVLLWMSQGIIYHEEDSQPEDTGLQYFNELFCRSFFQRSPFHHDHEDKFVMHKLFHDLAQSISKDECFSSEEPFCSFHEYICHLSLVLSDSKTVVLTKEHTHLQSLMVVREAASKYSSSFLPLLKILGLNDLLMKCRFLRVLNLSCTAILDLPSSIGKLNHLRFLALNNTKIKSLPTEIGQIDSLQTLELKDCCCLIELPESTRNLTKLRHLDVRKEPGYMQVGMPSGFGQLTDLQTLTIFNIGDDLSHCSVADLKNLSGLRGHVHITGLQNITAGDDAKDANLIGKQFLEALTLEWCCSSEDMEDDSDIEIANQVLQNLQPNTRLQELVIRNYSGNLFPIWMQDFSLCMLVSITIDNCQDCNEIPYLGDLPSLKYLFIQRMYAVECFGQRSNSLTTEGKHAPRFPSLETLNLWEMYSLQFWNGTSYGDFPQLHRFSVSRCPKLRNLPPLISLVHLSFHCGDQLPTCSELRSLKSLKIEGFQKLKSVCFCPEMPMLKKLEISDCKELVSVDAPLLSVSNLKVVRCPKLHFGGSSLEGCLIWETRKRDNHTVKSLLVKTMKDDGWKWRKYGQKDILGSKYQRSYFRCNEKNSMGCMARKIVEPNNDDPSTWMLTYIYEHNHQQGAWPCDEPVACSARSVDSDLQKKGI